MGKFDCHEDKDCNEKAVKQSRTTSNSEDLQTDYSIKGKKMPSKRG